MSKFQEPSGTCFVSPSEVPGTDLSLALRRTVSFVQARRPYTPLEQFDDWWEHDGLHFHRRSISFDQLFQMVHSPKALLDSMPGDFFVFVGIYGGELPFYLRFYIDWDDDEAQLAGRFDVTFSGSMADEYRNEIRLSFPISPAEQDSISYYEAIKNV